MSMSSDISMQYIKLEHVIDVSTKNARKKNFYGDAYAYTIFINVESVMPILIRAVQGNALARHFLCIAGAEAAKEQFGADRVGHTQCYDDELIIDLMDRPSTEMIEQFITRLNYLFCKRLRKDKLPIISVIK